MTSRYLDRFEDAELFRERLLQSQRFPQPNQPTLAEKVLIQTQKKRKTKRFRGKGGRLGKGRRGVSETIKGRPKVEDDLELARDKLRQEKAETERKERESYIQVQRDYRQDQQRDRELDIQDRTAQAIVLSAQLKAQAKDTASQRKVFALQAESLANRQANAQLEDRRQQLAREQIAAGHLRDRRQRGLEHRRLNAERERYNADLQDRRQQREADIARQTRELDDVRERVARQDEARAREIGQQHDLAVRELAERGREREAREQNERFKIDAQRQVDADRAESDRERERTLQEALNLLRHNQPPDPFGDDSSGGLGHGGGSLGGSRPGSPSLSPREAPGPRQERSPTLDSPTPTPGTRRSRAPSGAPTQTDDAAPRSRTPNRSRRSSPQPNTDLSDTSRAVDPRYTRQPGLPRSPPRQPQLEDRSGSRSPPSEDSTLGSLPSPFGRQTPPRERGGGGGGGGTGGGPIVGGQEGETTSERLQRLLGQEARSPTPRGGGSG